MTTKNFVVKNGLEAGNITLDAITNIITTTGNVNAANLLTGGNVSATGNVTGNNLIVGNIISAGGNITGANVLTIGNVSASGAVLGSNVYVSSLGSEQIAIAYTSGQLVGGIDLRWEFSNAALWATNIKSNGYISTSGNITGANLLTSGAISTSGNINANNLTTTGNISANNATVTGILSVSGNLDYTGANAYFSNVSNIKIPGGTANYVLTTDGTGNVSWQPTGQGNANVAGNNTEVQFNNAGVLGASANFTFNNTTNTLSVTNIVGNGSGLTSLAGGNVTGTVANATHACTANVVTDGTQSNITAVGTLTSLSSTGNIAGANLLTAGLVSAGGNVTGNFILGNGYYLTGVVTNSSTILNGNSNIQVEANSNVTVSVAGNANVLIVTGTGSNVNGYLYVTGNITGANANLGNTVNANFFIGSGNNLSNIQGANVSGTVANANYAAYAGDVVNASQPNITSLGTLSSLSVSGNANTGNVNTGIISASGNLTVANANLGNLATANYFAGNAANLFGIPGSNVTGTVANATHASTANTVVDGTQSNITTVGTLTNLSVSGNANIGNNVNVSGNAVITGNLVVGGNTVYVNVETIRVEDPIIELGGGPNGDPLTSDDGKDRGTLLHYYSGSPIDAFMGWDASNSEFAMGSNVSVTNEVVTFNTLGNLRIQSLAANIGNFSGNIIAANANLGNAVSANFFIGSGNNLSNIQGGNVTGQVGNAAIAGSVYSNSQPNITSVGTLSSLSVSGNANTGNVNTGIVSASGNIQTASYFVGDGGYISNITVAAGSYIVNGNSNVHLDANSNLHVDIAGNLDVLLVTGTGANVNGYLAISGNLSSGNANLGNLATANYFSGNAANLFGIPGANVTGTVANATHASTANTVVDGTQSNITSVGTLTSVSVSGNANVGNLGTTGLISATGNVTGNYILGNGAFLTGVSTSSNSIFNGNSNVFVNANSNVDFTVAGNANVVVITGTGANINGYANITGNVTSANLNTGVISGSGNLTVANANLGNLVTANFFAGNAANLFGIPGANVTGTVANATHASTANTVVDGNQSNITAVGTLTSLSVSGNIASNNLNTSNIISAGGNITGANLLTNNQISATGNITTANYFIGNGYYLTGIAAGTQDKIANGNSNVYIPTANGDITITSAGNANIVVVTGTGVNVTGTLSTSGNLTVANANLGNLVTANFFQGDGGLLTNITVAAGSSLVNGNSNVIVDANSNVRFSIAGTANVVVLTDTGANINGYANITGNANIANIGTGLISASSNITGANILTGGNVSATGNVDANNVNVGNIISASGNITGNYILGNGAFLTGIVTGTQSSIANGNSNVSIPAANGNIILSAEGNANVVVVTGTGANILGTANITGNTQAGNFNTAGEVSATGNITTANYFIGNGYYLTGLVTGTQDKIANGNSNVYIPLANGNVTITSEGNANIVVVTGTGVNIAGYANITGNANIGNLGVALITATGNVIGANLNTTGLVCATGNVNGNNINAGNLVSTTDLSASGNAVIAGNLTVSGTTEYINVTNLAIKDPIISIGRGTNNAPLTTDDGKDRGEQLWYYSGSEKSSFIGYDNSAGKLIAATDVTISSEVVTVNTYGNFVTGGIEANTVSTVGNIDTANSVSAAGNVNANNINVGNIISATGNITGNYILGNGAFLTGIAVGVQDKIANGNSNVYIPSANGNVTITTAGNANVVVITGTGANITGYANITGNITSAGNLSITGNINGNVITGNGSGLSNLAGANISGQVANALVAGTVYTAAQPNITSVGTLTGLTVGPNSSVILSGNTGFVRANSIQGRDGSQAIYPYYQNVSGAVGIVTDLTVGASGGGNLTVANGNVAFSGSNVSLGNISNLHIDGGTLNYFLKTDGSGTLSWALPSASPGGSINELQFNDTGVFAGTANLEYDSTEYRLSIQNYSLVVQTLGGVSGATTINVTDGCFVTATSAGITTWIFSFAAPSTNASGFVLELTNGGTYTQNWPLSVRWPGGSAPDLTATGVDVLVFITNDNGTTWRGAVSMLNST